MRVGHQTRIGRNRRVNQDRFFVDQQAGLFIVADGMGGHNAGEIAGSIAVSEISRAVREGLGTADDASVLLQESVLRAHNAIFENSVKFPSRRDMGTTVAVVLVQDDQVWVCHVGDSRVYLIGRGEIQPLTRDHTFVAEWLQEGRITPQQARTHDARHGLTMALGVDDDIRPEVTHVSWHEGQCLLLCSDGLTEMLEDSTILEIVKRAGEPDFICKELLDQALLRGGDDDITVVLVCR
ncbi:MAG: Stp1/IreP family PP2C-type Ser/Thr phosphatase [Desulfomonilaceae bacterium]|nr:Stp1/IreP family PP2C-type Ser/Thr phosphatase [Desulfomonilaceae bacterium]